MQTRILLLTLSISIAFNLHFFFSDKEARVAQISQDKVATKLSAIAKKETPSRHDENLQKIKADILEIDDAKMDEINKTQVKKKNYINEKEIDGAKEAWRRSATDFFSSSVGLNHNQIEAYFKLDQNRNKELENFLEHRLSENGGDQFFYTVEDIVEENKINIKYLSKLQNLLGREGYELYKEFRDQYNQKIIDSGEGFFLIEL